MFPPPQMQDVNRADSSGKPSATHRPHKTLYFALPCMVRITFIHKLHDRQNLKSSVYRTGKWLTRVELQTDASLTTSEPENIKATTAEQQVSILFTSSCVGTTGGRGALCRGRDYPTQWILIPWGSHKYRTLEFTAKAALL
jgi:hypothetical protein